nr:hypothetical protein [Brevundimonas diminuta]
MTTKAAFTVADIKRAIMAMQKAGQPVAAVDFPKEGGFRLVLGEPPVVAAPFGAGVNEWDSVLPQ